MHGGEAVFLLETDPIFQHPLVLLLGLAAAGVLFLVDLLELTFDFLNQKLT